MISPSGVTHLLNRRTPAADELFRRSTLPGAGMGDMQCRGRPDQLVDWAEIWPRGRFGAKIVYCVA
jgi:hypothetical protein